ncbi:hypothetical protein [Bacillus sp. XF8]|uniref:hypothetical protein n=1 Tax=Bacillus sp. XF8 TaxID=2819289 RepID=UPI001AA07D8A|nr:hypothetical protein [Bacillus sp. XF8]MBO1579089.1 hypothetical protein [Bacillus sp. XF8]
MTSHSITLEGGSEKKINFGILIPKTAEKGIYEGYVVYTNKDNPSETYQIPFGINYVEDGFEKFTVLTKSLTTTSQSAPNPFSTYGIYTSLKLKSNVKRVDFMLVDTKTNKYVGSLGFNSNLNGNPRRVYSSWIWDVYTIYWRSRQTIFYRSKIFKLFIF